jgi:hypothetical protein
MTIKTVPIPSCPWCGCTDQTKLILQYETQEIWCENHGCAGEKFRLPVYNWCNILRNEEYVAAIEKFKTEFTTFVEKAREWIDLPAGWNPNR